jgi:hypothetical protein
MMSLLRGVGADLDMRSRLPHTLAKILSELLGQLTISQVRYCIHKFSNPTSDDEVLLAETGDRRVSGHDSPSSAMTCVPEIRRPPTEHWWLWRYSVRDRESHIGRVLLSGIC